MDYVAVLTAAVMEHDRKEKRKQYYNMYAMPQYLKRVQEVAEDIERGAPVRQAILAGFTGRLADRLLKAVGEPKAEREEKRGSGVYRPVTKRTDS